MSLQVWLPLNGDLHNQGLSNINFSNTGVSIDDNGKIGKCYHFNADQYIKESTYDWTNFNTSEFSLCCWYKEPSPVASGNSQIICIGTSSGWNNIRIGLLRRTSNGYPLFSVSDGSTAIQYNFTASIFTFDTWNHIAVTYNNGELKMYLNGVLNKTGETTITPVLNSSQHLGIGAASNGAEKLTGYLNDVRIYDHCLSAKEVEEISKGLILHYKLDNNGLGGRNLMLGTMMTTQPIVNSTNYTANPLRFYNTSASNCTIANNEATILLNSTANLGIAFERLASEINLDPNEYYTLSCEAKTSMSGAQLAIGTTYYNTSDTGVWRGGANKKAFTALNQWQTFSITFKPDSDIKAICYCFTINGTSEGTETAVIRHCKLEKGSIVTSWSPAPEEIGADNIIYDSSGYENHGIAYGNININNNSARYSACTYFPSGNTDYIVTQNSIGNPIDEITMNIWFKSNCLTPGNNYHEIFNIATATQEYEFAINKNGFFRGGMKISGTRYVANTANLELLDGNWHMLTMTYDGANLIRYVDSIERSRTEIIGTLTGDCKFMLGHYGTNTSYYAKEAYLSDVRIYATALTEKQIKELYDTAATVDNFGNLYVREAIE